MSPQKTMLEKSEYERMLNDIMNSSERINEWEYDFIQEIEEGHSITENQYNTLIKIYKKYIG